VVTQSHRWREGITCKEKEKNIFKAMKVLYVIIIVFVTQLNIQLLNMSDFPA
jgi:hypothetical protein